MQVTDSLASAANVTASVTERERLNSQIFPEMEFCLLHSRSDAVTEMEFCLLHSRSDAVTETIFVSCTPREAERFTDPSLKGIKAAVLLLMPVDDYRRIHADVLGRISAAFVRNEDFLSAISRQENEVRRELTHRTSHFFHRICRKTITQAGRCPPLNYAARREKGPAARSGEFRSGQAHRIFILRFCNLRTRRYYSSSIVPGGLLVRS